MRTNADCPAESRLFLVREAVGKARESEVTHLSVTTTSA